jgi:hypothetical protein
MLSAHWEPDLVTDEGLLGILDELRRREPLFHRRDIVSSREDFERETAEDFWEVGASGRPYSRAFVWSVLSERYASGETDTYESEAWTVAGEHLREVAPQTYLLTYTLSQRDRLTRRLTVWQGSPRAGWKALYHQGTVISPPEAPAG